MGGGGGGGGWRSPRDYQCPMVADLYLCPVPKCPNLSSIVLIPYQPMCPDLSCVLS